MKLFALVISLACLAQAQAHNPAAVVDRGAAKALSKLSVGVDWAADHSASLAARSKATFHKAKTRLQNETLPDFTTDDVQKIAMQALSFLESEQTKQSTAIYSEGEWPSQAIFRGFAARLGFNQRRAVFEDPNSFVTTAVINLLMDVSNKTENAEVQSRIEKMVSQALNTLPDYEDGNAYHFYPLDRRSGFHRAKTIEFSNFLGELILVPSDSDSTANVMIALHRTQSAKPQAQNRIQNASLEFDRYVDRDRSPHPYNKLYNDTHTGAYLTWFLPEPKKYSVSYQTADVGSGYRLPWGKNDVDCVVNANILRALSLTQNKNSSSYQTTCDYLNKVIAENKSPRCAIYYPNSFYLHFVMTSAINAGARCLKPSENRIASELLSRQLPDGSWVNLASSDLDATQTTLFAMASVLNLMRENAISQTHAQMTLARGLRYLLSKAKNLGPSSYWEGGVFFSAVPPLKHNTEWRSRAFTTALAASVLFEVLDLTSKVHVN